MKKLLLTLLTLATISVAYAQPEATMYTLRGVPQFTNYNPAFVPQHKFVFGLPSVHASYSNNGFAYNDVFTKQGDSTIIDLNKLQSRLAKRNYINIATDVEVFRLGFKVSPRLYTNFSVGAKAFARVMLPKDLTTLFIDGTAEFVNGTATLAPEVEAFSYIEAALGGSYVVNKKLTVGARFKLLKGAVNGTTDDTKLTLSLNEDYAMTVRAQMDVRSSGIQSATDSDFDPKVKDYLKNNGFAIDLGGTYKLTDKLMVGASLIDIGGINWKNDNYAYTLNPDSASYTFSGIDVNKLIENENYLEEELDSVAKNFEPKEGVMGSYRTPLPTKMYLTAQYDLGRKFSASGVFFLEKFRSRFYPGFSLALHKDVGRIAGLSLSYTAANRDYTNLGFAFNLNLTILQIYVASDNLLGAPLSYLANGSYSEFVGNLQQVNVRTGLNFVFGRIKEQEKSQQPYNKRRK